MTNFQAMLELPRKIESETEGEQVLNLSYQMLAPLGVPTLIIDPAEYDPQLGLWCVETDDTIENHLKQRLDQVLHHFYGPDHAAVRDFQQNPGRFWMTLLNTVDYCVHSRQMIAHALNAGTLFNVVICPRTNNTGALLIKHGLHIDEDHIADIPGSDIEWNFIRLWHEFGHGLRGVSEAEADKVSALMHRHVFTDPQALMVLSDFRAAWAMIHHDQTQALTQRGWALVDTLDQVVSGFDEETGWDQTMFMVATPAPADSHAADVYSVGHHLKKICKAAFAEPDLLMLSMMADHAAIKGQFHNQNQMRIARRFALAAQRISLGRPAYQATTARLQPA